jgi:hypothetical protein
VASRAILFAVALAAVAGITVKVQRWFSIDQPFWVVSTAVVGLALYWRSRRWTGGVDLRGRIRGDLTQERTRMTSQALMAVNAGMISVPRGLPGR